jgi:CDP-diacylglycerol---glycerol-3-phosphate 3-phosphatidyltransferase
MPSIYDLKPKFQAILRPLTAKLANAGVTANQVTIVAALISIISGGLIALSPGNKTLLLLIPLVLFIRMALNAIDGMLAREHNMKSALGAILNELGDVIADAALYLPLALIPGVEATSVVIVVVLAIISEMTGVVAIQIGATRCYDGPMGKSDRAFCFGAIALLLGLGIAASLWLQGLLLIMIALLFKTIVNRINSALRELGQ